MEAQLQDRQLSIGLLLVRVGIGGFMLTHGWGKLQMLLAGNFDMFGDPIGLGKPLSLFLVVIAEFVGALLVILGLATRAAALLPAVAMGVAALVAHGSDPWTMEGGYKLFMTGASKSWSSKEPALLFLIPFLALVFTGAGRYSLDALVGPRWRERRVRRAAAVPA